VHTEKGRALTSPVEFLVYIMRAIEDRKGGQEVRRAFAHRETHTAPVKHKRSQTAVVGLVVCAAVLLLAALPLSCLAHSTQKATPHHRSHPYQTPVAASPHLRDGRRRLTVIPDTVAVREDEGERLQWDAAPLSEQQRQLTLHKRLSAAMIFDDTVDEDKDIEGQPHPLPLPNINRQAQHSRQFLASLLSNSSLEVRLQLRTATGEAYEQEEDEGVMEAKAWPAM